MDRPKTNNITAYVQGRNLNVFQKADAVIEYNKLLDYIDELEQLTIPIVSKSVVCGNCDGWGYTVDKNGRRKDHCKECE